MDQVKIGKFIQEIRKEQSLTQRELAEKLNISDKTISKWETGNGLPDVSLMLPLCELLHISVNELLSGKKLDEKQYFEKAEENIMDLLKERADAKKKIILSLLIMLMALISAVTFVVLASYLEMPIWLRVFLIAIAVVIIAISIGVACVLDREAGVYECKNCGERFVPNMSAYFFSPHTITRRWLKCPKCGKRTSCKKHLSKK